MNPAVSVLPNTGAPAAPGEASPRPAHAANPNPDLRLMLVLQRLSRALQRAVMYPPEHPAVGEAVAALTQALLPELRRSTLSMIVARERLLVSGQSGQSVAYDLPSLSARLHARGVASLALDSALDPAGVETLIGWLAEAGGDLVDRPPDIRGVLVTLFDGRLVRFAEQTGDDPLVQAEAEVAWSAIASTLAADWRISVPALPAPGAIELADLVRTAITENEGLGVAELSARIVEQGERIAQAREAVRAILKRRLGAFITRLAPELSSQLLTIGPTDSPEKLTFLAEMIDVLPGLDLFEAADDAALLPTSTPRQFALLLKKMASLSAPDPESPGSPRQPPMPAYTLLPDDSPLRRLVEVFAETRHEKVDWVPESYRAQLERLSAHVEGVEKCEFPEFVSPRDASSISDTTTRICVALLRTEVESSRRTPLLKRAREAAPDALQGGRLRVLGEAVAVIERMLAEGDDLGHENDAECRGFLDWCQQPKAVDAVVGAAERGANVDPVWLRPLLRATGRRGVEAILFRLARAIDRTAKDRLALTALGLPDEWFQEAVLPRVVTDAALATALIGVLTNAHPRRRRAIVDALAGHRSSDVRVAAMRVLFSDAADVAAFEDLVARALDDHVPEVVELGLEQAFTRWTGAVGRSVSAFLGRLQAPPLADMQRQAVALLARRGTPEAWAALAAALGARRRGLRRPARHVSRAIEAALCQSGAHDSDVRSWRRSPAGLCSRLLDRRQEEAA